MWILWGLFVHPIDGPVEQCLGECYSLGEAYIVARMWMETKSMDKLTMYDSVEVEEKITGIIVYSTTASEIYGN